jgi:hypothetical protein
LGQTPEKKRISINIIFLVYVQLCSYSRKVNNMIIIVTVISMVWTLLIEIAYSMLRIRHYLYLLYPIVQGK